MINIIRYIIFWLKDTLSLALYPLLFKGGIGVCIFIAFFSSCSDLEDKVLSPSSSQLSSLPDMLILSEGLFNHNNSSLTSIQNGVITHNAFQTANHRGLGDTANDMLLYGSKLYIAVNVSSTLEVVDAHSLKSLAQISLVSDNNTSRQPRYSIGVGKYVYTCCFDGSVCRTDTASLSTEVAFLAGLNPDGIAYFNNRIYVSNSGGLHAPSYGNTLSVYNVSSNTKEPDINVALNPGKLLASDDFLAILSRGDYNNTPSQLQIMDKQGSLSTIKSGAQGYTIHDNEIYMYDENNCLFCIALSNHSAYVESISTVSLDEWQNIRLFNISLDNYGNIYLVNAKDYTTLGDLIVLSNDGSLITNVSNIGLNSNTVLFHSVTPAPSTSVSSPQNIPLEVIDFSPAPGQFINTAISAYPIDGMSYQEVLKEATNRLNNNELISLGGFGGSITVKLNSPIKNIPNKADFKVLANAIYSTSGNSAEPGIIHVSQDGVTWYEIYGSAHNDANTIKNYSLTYSLQSDGSILWEANDGSVGIVERNDFHKQSYFPAWVPDNLITVSSTRLPDVARYDDSSKQWLFTPFAYGYVDNMPNKSDACLIDLDWAHDSMGNPIVLNEVLYLRITTAVHQTCGILGEVSTEVSGIQTTNQ